MSKPSIIPQNTFARVLPIPGSVDIVNIFRRSEYLSEIVDEAIAINAKTVWAQLGVVNQQAAQKALDAGLNVVMDTCIKVEYLRLGLQFQVWEIHGY
ncbi:hypothetical protein BLD44_029500 [Mastigocladus laminosus UU774]|nr:hypothetical protein BLD44_029500 [Mastigocladus laminosus UU774]